MREEEKRLVLEDILEAVFNDGEVLVWVRNCQGWDGGEGFFLGLPTLGYGLAAGGRTLKRSLF